MYNKNEEVILNIKIGIIKELCKRQLITQKQMEDTVDLIILEYKKQNIQR